jgi:hypothetical protein
MISAIPYKPGAKRTRKACKRPLRYTAPIPENLLSQGWEKLESSGKEETTTTEPWRLKKLDELHAVLEIEHDRKKRENIMRLIKKHANVLYYQLYGDNHEKEVKKLIAESTKAETISIESDNGKTLTF